MFGLCNMAAAVRLRSILLNQALKLGSVMSLPFIKSNYYLYHTLHSNINSQFNLSFHFILFPSSFLFHRLKFCLCL